MKLNKNAEAEQAQKKLRSLAPECGLREDEKPFRVYEDYLNNVFDDPAMKNVAISGNYGSGKSSILRSFDRKRNQEEKFLYISLMDFENYKDKKEKEKSTGEKPSAGGKDTDKEKGSSQEEAWEAARKRVEYSVLCQILAYCREPERRHSSVRGIPAASFTKKEAGFGAAAAVLVFLLIFREQLGLGWLTWPMFALCAVAVFLVAYHFLSRGRSVKVTVKSSNADLEMSMNQAESSLDLHRFELIYALNGLAKDCGHTVVFEDMDRLEPEIYIAVMTKLRDLNAMVNNQRRENEDGWRLTLKKWALKIKQSAGWAWLKKQAGESFFCRQLRRIPHGWLSKLCGRVREWLMREESEEEHIRFIYAIGEDDMGHELRTKFFDCIIPVMPALNQYNSEILFTKALRELGVDVDGAAVWNSVFEMLPFMNDYRTVNTFCNEFRILRDLFGEDIAGDDWNNSVLLDLTFYKVMVPKKFAEAFSEEGGGELPVVTKDDLADFVEEKYKLALAKALNEQKPLREWIQMLYLSEKTMTEEYVEILRHGAEARRRELSMMLARDSMIGIPNSIRQNRLFEKEPVADIARNLAYHVYFHDEEEEAATDDWFYAPGEPEEHKFTNCMAYLATPDEYQDPVALPERDEAFLFDWCVAGLRSLKEDPDHEYQWDDRMRNLLRMILELRKDLIPKDAAEAAAQLGVTVKVPADDKKRDEAGGVGDEISFIPEDIFNLGFGKDLSDQDLLDLKKELLEQFDTWKQAHPQEAREETPTEEEEPSKPLG